MKSSDNQNSSTFDSVRERVLLTLNFLDQTQDLGPIGEQMRNVIDSASAKRDLKALRLIARDLDALTTAMPPHERDGLEAVLKSRLRVDKDAERAAASQRVASVLRRGKIRSEKERQHLQEYLDT